MADSPKDKRTVLSRAQRAVLTRRVVELVGQGLTDVQIARLIDVKPRQVGRMRNAAGLAVASPYSSPDKVARRAAFVERPRPLPVGRGLSSPGAAAEPGGIGAKERG